ncbi:hypothetical protein EJB05_13735, partial [Eragrostis curvula]
MEDPPRFLPADVLTGILRRLPPRDLAVSRSVCKAWRAVVDAGRMLRPDLLPLSVGGIFISLARQPAPPLLFAPPAMAPKIGGKLERYVKMEDCFDIPTIIGCCNGLLFLDDQVVNPVTRRWAPVPPCPVGPDAYNQGDVYLVFDPSVSPHYEVLLIQDTYSYEGQLMEEGSEWPPSTCMMWVYSSRTGRWEKKPFVREGGPAGTVAEVRSAPTPEYRHAVYWHGALYAHCKNDFIMRINVSNYKYQVVKLPAGVNAIVYFHLHLVKSKYGVYFALLCERRQLRVWFLNEFGAGHTEWVLKYDTNLETVLAQFSLDHDDCPINRPWMILQDDNYNNEDGSFEWDFENNNLLEIIEGADVKCYSGFIYIFGFHPFKEVVFLYLSNGRVVACHLNNSKIQDLGQLHLPYRPDVIDTTFVYTPCWMGELSEHY